MRLLSCLGHGAFSAVWLAEDLSRVPLTLVSKKSVKDLRRRASGRDRDRRSERKAEESDVIPAVPDIPQSAIGESKSSTAASSTFSSGWRSQNKLREGLRNMLSFSRSSHAGLSSPHAAPEYETMDDYDLSLSRQSSIKSLPSNASDDGSLSRTSSITSSKAPSRNSSLRIQGPNGLTLSRDSSMKKFRERVKGTRPAFRLGRMYLDERHGEMGEPRDSAEDMHKAWGNGVDGGDGVGLGASLSRQASLSSSGSSRLVAVKMTPRRVQLSGGKSKEREEEERTRVGFVREVEILKVSTLLFQFSAPTLPPSFLSLIPFPFMRILRRAPIDDHYGDDLRRLKEAVSLLLKNR